MKVIYETNACKFCGSVKVVRYGKYRGIQRFLCRACGRKFADNDALPDMHTPSNQVVSAVNAFYEGMSLAAIQRQITVESGNTPSDSTVYRWIQRFTDKAIKETKGLNPNVGEVWVADETVLKIGGKNVWFWDIIDAKTRYLLASRMSTTRTTRDAQTIMELAAKKAGKSPRIVLTDKLAAYLDGVELAYGSETKHIPIKGLTAEDNTNLIERFHGTLKQRTKVMRGLKSRESAKRILDGWLIHYNYFHPHESLRDKTPAEVAGVKVPYTSWRDVVTKSPSLPFESPKLSQPVEIPHSPLLKPATVKVFGPSPKQIIKRL